jgi:hypothetical protein
VCTLEREREREREREKEREREMVCAWEYIGECVDHQVVYFGATSFVVHREKEETFTETSSSCNTAGCKGSLQRPLR